MATTPKKDAGASGVLQDQPTPTAAERGDHDRIVMASRRADGSMDQVDPEFIGDKDVALAAAKEQLAVQATSAVDVAARGVTAGQGAGGAESADPDPDIKALKDAQEKAAEAAEARAEAEVTDRHQGLGD
ncbi:hypothetical protein GR131_16215 [Streptomyces sp. GF20]|uniref:hypothetical protein n=1 Tax=Streptomyces sp. GF20 TaxID=2692235 RepID=UPI0013164FA8|nr:hypothetical protein [Streptomyces sp. GF20]QHC16867.1 hypothetical protein GR131_16215 [Streptomyces sp. GF20]